MLVDYRLENTSVAELKWGMNGGIVSKLEDGQPDSYSSRSYSQLEQQFWLQQYRSRYILQLIYLLGLLPRCQLLFFLLPCNPSYLFALFPVYLDTCQTLSKNSCSIFLSRTAVRTVPAQTYRASEYRESGWWHWSCARDSTVISNSLVGAYCATTYPKRVTGEKGSHPRRQFPSWLSLLLNFGMLDC